ncbi:O-antigen ligase family protein [Terriglobus roseus]|uniref:O-antigen ligase n=1 Tax=Terriglobus roseus TaxID=392734 RepID=A0A1H4SHE2_9BACT|nr:O-antigen ligase family protein [Terriglobus roseus]SEC43569.1 O-antigen ligase [Terriglobus roseus]
MWVVLLFLTLGIMVAALRDPRWGMVGFLLIFVVQPGELYPALGVFHLERLMGAVILISMVVHHLPLRFPVPTKCYLGFFLAMLVAVPFAFWPSNSLQMCINYFEVVFFHLVMVATLTSEALVTRFVTAYVAATGWLAGTSLFLYMTGVREFHMNVERATGLTSSGGDANTLGISLVLGLPFCALLMRAGNPRNMRLLGLVVFLLSATTILITGSRTSAMTMAFVWLLLALTTRHRVAVVVALAISLPIIWIALPQQYKDRYATVQDLSGDESFQNRVYSWKGGVRMFEDNPLTGVGSANYAIANGTKFWPGPGRRHWLDAHSLYFKLLGELGAIGVLSFSVFIVSLVISTVRARRRCMSSTLPAVQFLPVTTLIVLTALFITGYSAHNLYRVTWGILGALASSMITLPSAAASVEPTRQIQKKKPLWSYPVETASPVA